MTMFNGRILILLSLIFFPFLNVSANEADIEKLIKRGLDKCYNFNWNSAEEDFEEIIRLFPNDPRGYHYKSGIYLWYYLSSEQEKDFEQFLKYSDVALQKGERILEESPDDVKINYTLGNAYSYRTLGYAKSESYINAIFASKKSESFLKGVIENNPSMYDAYLGLGLYNFAAAQIPSAFKWALNLAGISGDEETGIKYIKITADKGNLSRIEARYYLSQILSGVIMDFKSAGEILYGLSQNYPSNILFNYGLAVVNMKERDPGKAESILLNIVNKNIPKFRQVISLSNFLLGDVYYRNNDFLKALGYYKTFLRSSRNKDYTGIASLRAGLCLEITGDRQSALEYYSKAAKGNQDIEDDVYAKRRGDIYRSQKISDTEVLLIKYSNMIEWGKSQNAYDGLIHLQYNVKNTFLKAELFYSLSEAAFELKKYAESFRFALDGAKIDVGEEGWITAYCFYNAARGSYFLGKREEAEKYMERAEDENNWDYQNRLKNLLKTLPKQ